MKKVLLKSVPVDPGRHLSVSLKRKNSKMLPFDKTAELWLRLVSVDELVCTLYAAG